MADDKALTQVALPEDIEKVLIAGDLKELTPAQRVSYYRSVCQSLGLNPLTRPFEYIVLNGKLTLYARKDATEQLRKLNGVSITKMDEEFNDLLGQYIVTAHATDKIGRTDISKAAVNIKGVYGEVLSNAIMRCETKAKRRVTLSICGLGWMDETEVETVKDAKPIVVSEAGEIVDSPLDGDDLTGKSLAQLPGETVVVVKRVPPTIAPDADKDARPVIVPNAPAPQVAVPQGVSLIWNGTKYLQIPSAGKVTKGMLDSFLGHHFGKGKAFEVSQSLYGDPDPKKNNPGHLGKWYGRKFIVNPRDLEDAMTGEEFAELWAYALWVEEAAAGKPHEHGKLASPRYDEKVKELEVKQEKREAKAAAQLPTMDTVRERAQKLGASEALLTALQVTVYSEYEVKPDLTQMGLNETQIVQVMGILDIVESGALGADDSDQMISMLALAVS